MAKPLDVIDQHILQLLRSDGRMPLVGLADAIGLSRSATQDRLARLERDDVILGYTIRYRTPSATTTQAWLIVRFTPGTVCRDVVPALLLRTEIKVCHSLAGQIDLLLLVEVDHPTELMTLREHVAGLKGISEVVTAPIIAVHTGAPGDLPGHAGRTGG